MRAFSGVASGTWMTSMLNSDVFGIRLRLLAGTAGQLLGGPDRARAGSIDVDVGLVVRIGDKRVSVRPAARLDGGDLLRFADVRDVEDANAAEPFGVHRRLDAGVAAVDAASRLLDRHEQQVSVDRDVTLAAGTHHRGHQLRLARILDGVGVETVEIAGEEPIARERDVRVGEVQAKGAAPTGRWRRRWLGSGLTGCWRRRLLLGRRHCTGWRLRIEKTFGLGQVDDELHVPGGDAGVAKARLQADARIGGGLLIRFRFRLLGDPSGRARRQQGTQPEQSRQHAFHRCSSLSITVIRSISIRWSASTSDANAKTSDSWPARGVANSCSTIVSAPE